MACSICELAITVKVPPKTSKLGKSLNFLSSINAKYQLEMLLKAVSKFVKQA